MRFVVLGAGAIGGAVGALLARAGLDVVFIARGPHGDAIRERGLRVDTPDETFVAHVPVMDARDCRDGDVVLLAVKTQDAELAIRDIPPHVPIACLTNGVAAERIAARHAQSVYGAYVFVGGSHLEPGSVQLWSSPIAGVIDIGAYPQGEGPLSAEISAALQRAGFASVVRDDVMRYKRGKLLMNLLNVVEALCGPFEDDLGLEARARTEAIACFDAAGLAYTIDETRFVDVKQIRGASRPGGSTWQSRTRGKALETDYLNGEIVSLGRAHGIPTPTNTVLQRLGAHAVSMTLEAVVEAVNRGDEEDVPIRVDHRDPVTARAWLEDTRLRKPFRKNFRAAFCAALSQRPRLRILELGSGPGELAREILLHCDVASYTALDWSQAMHDMAADHLGDLAPRVTFVVRDFREPTWPSNLGPFDAIVTQQAVHETRHRRHALPLFERARTLLVPGGLLLYCDGYLVDPASPLAALSLERAEQPRVLERAGLVDVRLLHEEGNLVLYSATNPA